MKLIVDGKEIKFDHQIKVIYEDKIIGYDEDTVEECHGAVHITLTSEGMIADLIEDSNGEVYGTSALELLDIITLCNQ